MDQIKSIFLVGIKGVAMANLAIILQLMGKKVSGSDVAESFITSDKLTRSKIKIITSFSPDQIPANIDLVVYSAAHGGINNPQVVEARRHGILAIHQAQLIEKLLCYFKQKLVVCGCHGKTTAASLLSYSLIKLDTSPSYLVGAPSFYADETNFPGGYFDQRDYFVLEGDEYAVNPPLDKTPKFNYYHPDHILITNIDYDHPDVYDNLDQVKTAFRQFVLKSRFVAFCGDDKNSVEVTSGNTNRQSYGYKAANDLQITDFKSAETGSMFVLSYRKKSLGLWRSKLYGVKNISNLAGVVLLLINLDFAVEKIKAAVADFSGVQRRMELVFDNNNGTLFDDYAHHPAEIAATIDALRRRFPGRRLIAIFQPHTYSRTESLKNQFVESLSQANLALIAPVFSSAREKPTTDQISAKTLGLIARKKGTGNVAGFQSKSHLISRLSSVIKTGDVIITMGAGDIYQLKPAIINLLK